VPAWGVVIVFPTSGILITEGTFKHKFFVAEITLGYQK
jgi:hypothetical protein